MLKSTYLISVKKPLMEAIDRCQGDKEVFLAFVSDFETRECCSLLNGDRELLVKTLTNALHKDYTLVSVFLEALRCYVTDANDELNNLSSSHEKQ